MLLIYLILCFSCLPRCICVLIILPACYSYVSGGISVLVCTRVFPLSYLHPCAPRMLLVCFSYVTRTLLVCYSYVTRSTPAVFYSGSD